MCVVDTVPGSVVWDNSKNLLAVIRMFENLMSNFKYIQKIVRIKNDKYEYCDIKINLLMKTVIASIRIISTYFKHKIVAHVSTN